MVGSFKTLDSYPMGSIGSMGKIHEGKNVRSASDRIGRCSIAGNDSISARR